MDRLRTDFEVAALTKKIDYHSSILFIGSCFTEHMALELVKNKFKILNNPFGILYNPMSLAAELSAFMEEKKYEAKDLFEENHLFKNFDFHSRISHPDAAVSLDEMNTAVKSGNTFLKNASHLIITFGTSRVYQLKSTGKIAGNNHKQSAELFNRIQLKEKDILSVWIALINRLKTFNPNLSVLFTISPVRHFRDGAAANTRSKAVLISAVHELIEVFDDIYYFPAFEFMMDDLRDYRFYAEDMLHPGTLAIKYIFDRFAKACLDEKCLPVMTRLSDIRSAMEHRPFFPELPDHQQFMETYYLKAELLQRENPGLDLKPELDYFRKPN